MYPYPSGDLHIGHWYIKTPTDAIARYRRMNGDNVFFPIGFDAFGLPAENAAIKSGVHPAKWTMRNIERMRGQLRSMGATFDWSSEVVTCQPDYYRWNQWIFLQLLKAGLAYRKMAAVDWCPKDQVVLAREQVEGLDRVCWRCGTQVIKRDLEQWFFRITQVRGRAARFHGHRLAGAGAGHADQLDRSLRGRGGRVHDGALRPSRGRRGAARVHDPAGHAVRGHVHGPRAGASRWSRRLTAPERAADVEAYVTQTRRRTEIERLSTDRDKTGVPIGADAINPVNGRAHPHLDRRLCAVRLRHGRHHGRARP